MSFKRDIQKQNTGCLFYVMSATDSMYRKKKERKKKTHKKLFCWSILIKIS